MRRSARGGEGVRRGRPFSAVCRALPRREHVECSAVAYGVWWDAWRPPQSVPFWVSKQVWGAAAAGGENGERHVKEHVEKCIVASRTGDAGGGKLGLIIGGGCGFQNKGVGHQNQIFGAPSPCQVQLNSIPVRIVVISPLDRPQSTNPTKNLLCIHH